MVTKQRSRRKSRTTQLQVGEDSIDRVTPWRKNGKSYLDWSIRLHEGQAPLRFRSQGATDQIARQRARAKAEELRSFGTQATWKRTDKLTDFITQVSVPAMENARLRGRTQAKYTLLFKYLAGECSQKGCKHKHSLKGHPIISGESFAVIVDCLYEIRDKHGYQNGRQSRVIWNKYIAQPLKREGLIKRNPIQGERLNLTPHPDDIDEELARGGKALDLEEWQAVLTHLLAMDPRAGVTKPKAGRWGIEVRYNRRQNLIDLAILQAATGLRVNEATSITWQMVSVEDNGEMGIYIPKRISKTHKSRTVWIYDPDVINRILVRRTDAAPDNQYVIGAPSNPMKQWDSGNRGKAIADFYKEISAALEIELMENERTHMWRTTTNMLTIDDVPLEGRAVALGHHPRTNTKHYTDNSDTRPQGRAIAALRFKKVN